MKLLSSPPSPFGRKVKMVAKVKGIFDRLEVETVDASQAGSPAISPHNPLGKIPVLILDDGTALYDSHVISEYLDTLAPEPRLFPPGGVERFLTLRLGALADGIMEAALLTVYESRFRPETLRSGAWVDRQHGKIESALAYLERDPPLMASTPDYGHIALAAALGYLDLRLGGTWRDQHPALVGWLNGFDMRVPAFAETKVSV